MLCGLSSKLCDHLLLLITGPPNGPVLFARCRLSASSVVVCNARGRSAAAGNGLVARPAADTDRRDSTVTSRIRRHLVIVVVVVVAAAAAAAVNVLLGLTWCCHLASDSKPFTVCNLADICVLRVS